MKKRVLALLGATLLMASVTLTALAAPSTEAGVVTKVETAVDKDGNKLPDGAAVIVQTIEKVKSTYAPAELKAAEEIQKPAVFKEVLKDVLEDVQGAEFKESLQVADVKDVSIVGSEELVTFPLTITFAMNGVKKSDTVYVLHYDDKAGAWELLDSTVGDGTVTATFNSLSPVAFVVEKVDKAPAMGEPVMLMCAAAAVATGVAGIAASRKRR